MCGEGRWGCGCPHCVTVLSIPHFISICLSAHPPRWIREWHVDRSQEGPPAASAQAFFVGALVGLGTGAIVVTVLAAILGARRLVSWGGLGDDGYVFALTSAYMLRSLCMKHNITCTLYSPSFRALCFAQDKLANTYEALARGPEV